MRKAEGVQLQAKGTQQMKRQPCRHRNLKWVHSGDVYETASYSCLDCGNEILRLLFRAGKSLTEVEKSLIASKIDALRVDFPDWKKRRTWMPL